MKGDGSRTSGAAHGRYIPPPYPCWRCSTPMEKRAEGGSYCPNCEDDRGEGQLTLGEVGDLAE